MLLPGPTVVISPLLALQQDQIAGAQPAAATPLGRSGSARPRRRTSSGGARRRCAPGAAEFLFITPEQLGDPDRLAEVRALRPAWSRSTRRTASRPGATTSAPTTCTSAGLITGPRPAAGGGADRDRVAAGPRGHHRAARACATRDPHHRAGPAQPVPRGGALPDEEHRWRRLLALLRQPARGPASSTSPTRRSAEELADAAGRRGYRGGVLPRRDGRRPRATQPARATSSPTEIAGHGRDHRVRHGHRQARTSAGWHHVALPDSPDSYLQEIGRAGRDGAAARRRCCCTGPRTWRCSGSSAGGAPDEPSSRDLAAALRDGPADRDRAARAAAGSARASWRSCSACWSRSARSRAGPATS